MSAIEPDFAPAFTRWGKTARCGSGGYHLLVFHALDVGAVMQVGLTRNPRLLDHLAAHLALPAETTRRMLVALSILHDAGKCAGCFQSLAPEIAAVLGVDVVGLERYDRQHRGHDRMGQAFLRELARRGALGVAKDGPALNELLATFTGHHGTPPSLDERLRNFCDAYRPADLLAAEALGAIALRISGWDGALPDRAQLGPISYTLAGLATLCDWLGSSDRFVMQSVPEPPEVYFRRIVAGPAAVLVDEVKPAVFRPYMRPPRLPFARLFAHLSDKGPPTPTPMQAAVLDIAAHLPSGPKLLVIEDLTGSGKTEAADLFVHGVLAEGQATGVYYGLPTIATANAAYIRKRDALPGIAGPGGDLVLAHGQALGGANWSTRAQMEPGELAPHDWFTASSKRALLAGAGAGTIDQALAGALRARLASLRLLGLWDKVMVVDEVHACDPYMAGLLAPLLRHHAALGGSAVLLSATLPRDLHRRLADAFACGGGFAARPVTEPPGYPAITLHHSGRSSAKRVAPQRPPPAVALQRIDSLAATHEAVLGWLTAGRSVLWFRNTVGDAVDAAELLAPTLEAAGLPAPLLYHARFLPAHRSAIEQRVQHGFGKHADPAARRGRLLIATQVAEQSLDLDADELVSDLAPADVMIQRLGRRRRHARGADGRLAEDGVDRRPATAALIFSPDPAGVTGAAWCARLLPRTVHVYDDIARLWVTAAALFTPDGIGAARLGGWFDAVADARALLDTVYPTGSFAEADAGLRDLLPGPLRSAFDAAEGDAQQERSFAARHALPFHTGWLRDWWRGTAVSVDAEGMPKTRLGDIHEVVLLVRQDDGAALMDRDLRQSICRSPRVMRTTVAADAARQRLFLAGGLSDYDAALLREREVLLFDHVADGEWTGVFESSSGARRQVSGRCTYSASRGLQFET